MTRSRPRTSKPVALVTGASSGIGRACADELARAGFLVFGTSRRPRRAARSRRFQILALDVCEDASVADCIETVMAKAARIDALVNNAGVALVGAIEEITIAEFKKVVETNLIGAVRMMQAVLPIMRKQGGGRIVNMGSVAGFVPLPDSAAYCASKHAIRGLSESVDHEVRPFGIRVIGIEPGFIRTDIVEHSPVAEAREEYARIRESAVRRFSAQIQTGEDAAVVARAVLDAVTAADPETRYLPGNSARLMNLARTMLPSSWFDFGLQTYLRL